MIPDAVIFLLLLASPAIYVVAIMLLGYLPYRLPRVVCSSCDYSLRGLGERGTCPECGLKFCVTSGQSLVPVWHSGIARAVPWMALAAIAAIATATCLVFGESAFASSAWMPGILAVMPVALLLPFVVSRLPRMTVWAFVTLGALPGAAISTASFIMVKEVPDFPAVGLFIAAVLGGTVSSLLSGLVVSVSAARQHFRLAHHRRERRLENRSRWLAEADLQDPCSSIKP